MPSRRLGLSLGVDIFRFKTCTFNCVYCQLGPSRETRKRRGLFAPVEEVVSQVRSALKKTGRVDSITFSGSGEPTLHAGLGRIIRDIKKFTNIPVTVLTNGSLLSNQAVRRGLSAADRVVPSLDAASQEVFRAVNRPGPGFSANGVIRGLTEFRREYRGQIWLEVMLVRGVNDSPRHIAALKKTIARIRPDKVQLNTVVRPPAENSARPLSRRQLDRICRRLGPGCEVVAAFRGRAARRAGTNPRERVLATVRRRPVTAEDLGKSLGFGRKILDAALEQQVRRGLLKKVRHEGRDYFEPTGGSNRQTRPRTGSRRAPKRNRNSGVGSP